MIRELLLQHIFGDLGIQITLVQDNDSPLVLDQFHDLVIILIQRNRPVYDIQDQIRVPGLINCAIDTDLLDLIRGVPDSRGVQYTQGNSTDIDLFLQNISGCAGDIGDNCSLFPQQKIQQRGFSRVRLSQDHGLDSLLNQLS